MRRISKKIFKNLRDWPSTLLGLALGAGAAVGYARGVVANEALVAIIPTVLALLGGTFKKRRASDGN